MTALVYTLGVLLFALGVVVSIALHEVGHMVPAKKFGVKVSRYFVGFGKTVWSTKKGETEYGIKAFPLGGFIQMIGMLPPEKRHPDGRARVTTTGFFSVLIADARAAEYEKVGPEDQNRLFYTRPWWQKVIVMSGGPTVNLALAAILLGIVFMGFGVQQPSLKVFAVSDCVIDASEGNRACKDGDPISPAKEAGFKIGDQIVSLNGVRMADWDQFSRGIREIAGGPVQVGVNRDGEQLTLSTSTMISERPDLDEPDDPSKYVQVGFLGVTPDEVRVRQGPGYVASTMWDFTKRTAVAITQFPERMVGVAKAAVGQERAADSPMSVVGASRVAGEVASDDRITVADRWATLILLLGVVNLFVGLFNFIPLLPLDGGHIAGALYEAVRRGLARVRGRPDPGYADVAKMLPVAYALASVLLVTGVLLIWVDIVNPIRLGTG